MTFYPDSPLNIPANFTQPKKSYYFRASLALLGILLFFALYISLVYLLGYVVYLAFTYPMYDVNKFTIILKIGAIAGSVMLFIFALKFIFKLKNHKPTNRIKLKKEENPNLWEFILKICKETGAPKPKNIYLDPDVNAYVSYTNTWLSLFLPIKKELTIGMGITESLNLSEFKAVMTHEFGHFAQRSMKIGSYIMTANTIIHDMIFSRDSWDRALETWRSSDIRLSAAAWAITPVIWVLRQLLNLFYQFLNIMYSSLSREMEFNADKYAVSTTGSEPIVSGLWKLETAFQNWNNQLNLIYLASLKQLYPENIYAHYNLIIEKANVQVKSNYENLPLSDLGGKKFFEHSANSTVSMYASHPPNNLRELNAKTPYIPCFIDEGSPLQLFGNVENLQKQLTKVIFKQYFQKEPVQFCSFEEFENFTYAETAHKHLHKTYENTFESRFLNIPEYIILKNNKLDKANFQKDLLELQTKLKELLIPIKDIDLKIQEIIDVSNGTSKSKKIKFGDKEYSKKELQQVYLLATSQKEKMLAENFIDWDCQFCQLYFNASIDTDLHERLINYYNQHKRIIEFYKKLINTNREIINELQKLQAQQEVQKSELNLFQISINDQLKNLNLNLESLSEHSLYVLPNIDNWDEFKRSVVNGGTFKKGKDPIFENGDFDRILNDLQSGINHMQRIDLSSIGVILDIHERINEINIPS